MLAAPLITSPDHLLAAAGILAVEAHHAGTLRTTFFAMSQQANSVATYGIDIVATVTAINNLRNSLSGGLSDASGSAITGMQTARASSSTTPPTDANPVAFAREMLNVVYGAVGASSGLFFPDGMNGLITS